MTFGTGAEAVSPRAESLFPLADVTGSGVRVGVHVACAGSMVNVSACTSGLGPVRVRPGTGGASLSVRGPKGV